MRLRHHDCGHDGKGRRERGKGKGTIMVGRVRRSQCSRHTEHVWFIVLLIIYRRSNGGVGVV
eukprot:2951782-Prorocentrum_lima.AAC.1